MKKRLLALILTILTIVSGLPTTVFAAGEAYQIGDTFISDTNPPATGLPTDISSNGVWSGPMVGYQCGKEEHTHSINAGCLAYVIDPNRCAGDGETNWSHWWHSTDCYAIDASACPGGGTTGNNHRRHTNACYQVEATGTCTLEEHSHSSSCGTNYVWKLTEIASTDQYREWWPVYWDFDSQRNNPDAVWDESVVTVTAGGQAMAFSNGEVLSSTALSQAVSGTTATIGDVLSGIHITVDPGYFLTEYRLVCGNHTGCGIVTTTTSTGHNAEDYTATVDFKPSATSLDHWYNIGGMHNDEDENDGVYQPMTAPDPNANDIYHTSGSNTIYPFYLLLKVEKDNEAYSISYDWGDLQGQLSASVPAGEDNMLRNSSHTVKAPGAGATEAAALGYVFTGWKVDATGYNADAIVQPDHTVTVYGGDITLVAQWATAVSYVYTLPVPEGAPEAPASRHYDIGATVTVEGEPTLAGYTFSGWTTDDANVSGDTFTMPPNSVVFEGTFTKDDSQTKALYYQVEYYLNGQLQASETVSKTVSVWVNDPNTVTFDKALNKTFTDYALRYSAPADLAHYLIEPEHANDDYVFEASTDPNNPTVLKLYYTGTNADLSIEKAVMDQSGKILTHTDVVKAGQVLTYVITVTNKGNAPMTGVKITDTHNGDGLITFTDTTEIGYANGIFTIGELPIDDSNTANVNEGQVTITYTYKVAQADAGKTLVNYATWRSDDGSKESTDDAEVKVEEWYTLTIEYYADGVLQSGLTERDDMAAGDNYSIIVPTDITVNGDVYAFDAPATTDPLSGTLTTDTTVKLYYAKDELGNEDEPDGTPDKYQAIFEYVATTGGTITGIATEVVNVYNADAFVAAGRDVSLLTAEDMAVKGIAVASGSKAENTNASVYEFSHWTLARKGHATFEIGVKTEALGSYQLPPAGAENLPAHQTVAGATYVFTAVYKELPKPTLTLDKQVARHENLPVGTKVEYVIRVHNSGNVELNDVIITDNLFYMSDGGSLDLIPNYIANIDNVRISGTTADNYEIGTAYSYIKIRTLRADDTISIEYEYVIQPADAGKTIHNIADASATYGNESLFEEDSATITVAQKYYTVTYEDGWNGNAFAAKEYPGLVYGDATPIYQVTSLTYVNNGIKYLFAGWDEDPAGAMVAGDKTYTAQWDVEDVGFHVEHYLMENGAYGNNATYNHYHRTHKDGSDVLVGDTVSYANYVHHYVGYEVDKAEPASITISANEAENVIKIYYKTLHTVTYEDGVDGEEVFTSQVNSNLAYGDTTPGFNGTPERDGYYFTGWTPAVAPYVTDTVVYKATWAQQGGVTITGASDTVIYNGTEQSVVGYSVTGLPEGYTLEGIAASDYVAKGTDAGTYAGSFRVKASNVIVRDASGNDVTAQYVVTLVPGTLTVNKRTVTLTSESASKAYDGTALTAPNVTVGGDGFVSGEVTDVKATGSVTNVGSVTNTITYTEGAAFKADNYTISKTEGTLTVTADANEVIVTIVGNSETVTYDGQSHTVSGYTVASSNGQYTENDFTFNGTAIATGTDAGTYSMGLTASDFVNNNTNFNKVTFQVTDGTLTVNKRTVTLTSESASKAYDGTALTAPDVTVGGDGFVSGEVTDIKATGSVTNVGSVTNTITYTEGAAFKADNYSITKTEGTLTVTAHSDDIVVTITENSGSYQYDGTEKTVTGYDVTSIRVGGTDTTLYTEADFEFTGTASVSGTAAGTYNMELKASDFVNKNANFDGKVVFVIIDGTLTITNADPKVTVKYVLKSLSGSTTEVASAPYDGQQANPFTVAYNGSYTIAVGTGSGNYVAPATITVDSKNYNYSSASGALTATGVTGDVTVTLVYEEEFVFIPVIRYGTLEISKQLDAPADFPANTRFTFNIYRISYYNGNKTYYDTVYLKAGETVTLRVEMGNYYVEEADASVDGYKLVVDCTDSDCTVQVNGGAKASITFLNTYTELILELEDHFGYIIGYPDETVRPTQNITRAEVATIFFRMMTDTARAHYWSTENTFSDVSEDDWFNNAISTLQNAGVLDGYGDGTFRPNAYITRAELVKIAVSFYGTTAGRSSHFADVDAHWAEDFISAAEAIGFVDGYEDDTFRPDRLITRAETMKIVNRALGRKPHKDGLHKYMIEWADNMDRTKWYYAEVQEATNSHNYEWEDAGYETWTAILPVRNWAALEKSWSEAHD